ncbi:MAG TPA: SurA N-terminal domain-containing protein [Candidatus Solibacter sp.]|nr:SurA N-terminal domain-containing protein [Candidatus Solibacter sp.]
MIHGLARRHYQVFLIAAITVLLAGCTGCNRQESDKDVMAKVNGYKILRSEVDKTYNSQIANSPQKPTPLEEEGARLNILRLIIDVQLHLQKAEKLGIVAPEDEVDGKLNQAKAPYTKEEFDKKLKSLGLTEDEYKQELRHNITIEKLLNKEFASKITISDADIQNYYDQHKAEFNLIEPQYYLAHIFVHAPPSGPSQASRSESDAQARKKTQMIYNRLESGEDFANLATKYSDDVDTARNGGELSPAPESTLKSLDPPTWEAIQKLKAGQYSNILPVVNPQSHQQAGYRIIKLIHKENQGQRELSDVQQWIRNQLRGQREQLLRAAYDEALHDNAEIHNYYAEQIVKNVGQK